MTKQPKDMDFIAQAKASGKHFSDTAKSVTVTPTPASAPAKADGHLGDKTSNPGPKLYAPVNVAAKPNTYTGSGGSKS